MSRNSRAIGAEADTDVDPSRDPEIPSSTLSTLPSDLREVSKSSGAPHTALSGFPDFSSSGMGNWVGFEVC